MSEKLFGFPVDMQWDYENGFYLTSSPLRLAKALAEYDFYKMIIDLPGDIIQCGIYKGASLLRFATFREVLEKPPLRRIVSFDAFEKTPVEKTAGNVIPVEELNRVLVYKGFRDVELVAGDVVQMLPRYLQKHPGLKIALLHLDVDAYKPSLAILEDLWGRIVGNGIVVLDDYGKVTGQTKAADEFFVKKNVRMNRLSMAHAPAYVRKG